MKRRAILLSLPIATALAPVALAAPDLDTQAHFECLWWSETEMDGINPDRPPPKTTRVRIAKWEYSDPIGVPHPDEVFFVVSLRSARARVLSLSARVRWRLRGWMPPETLGARPVSVVAGETQRVEFTIPVARMILDREARGLRVGVLVDGSEARQFELPIQRGD